MERVSTRAWAAQNDYEPRKLFRKLFHDDIGYLLTMDKLWQKRRPPTPLDWDTLPDAGGRGDEREGAGMGRGIREACGVHVNSGGRG